MKAEYEAEALVTGVAHTILRLAAQQGMPQRALAAKSGVGRRTVERLLGQQSVGCRVTNLVKIVRALGYHMQITLVALDGSTRIDVTKPF